jgi:putative tricarboxylic transport membrane protein
MPSDARRGWLIATSTMLALCLFAAWQSWLLALTDKLGPGPGFFPFWLSLLGAVFSIVLLVGTVRTPAVENPNAEPVLPDAYGKTRIGAIVGTLAITILLMEVLGFQLAMLAFNVALVVLLGERRWIAIAIFAVVGSFGVHYVFTRWLDVLLPAGMLGL